MILHCELTDTMQGEANYSWVERHSVNVSKDATNLQIIRKAKQLLGLTGVKCRKEDYGDSITLKPYGMCMVAFISIEY